MTSHESPFSVRLDAGVLELTLDTPGCSHNIFSLDAAAQLSRILDEADPREVAVVLIKSGKPASFINGVGLLMAGTAQQPDDIPEMTQGVTLAYRALRDFPAPSVAAIAGNCYGCGVEFALHCDYRLACESYDTHFYMTELADYLFIPAFGATQDLPRLLGIEAAENLLLWGERWSARRAVCFGLVDHSFDLHEFEYRVTRFVETLATAPRKRTISLREHWSKAQEEHALATRQRIGTLPPAYQPVYQATHSLMLRAARATRLLPSDYAAELQACSESVVRPLAKASVAFFFIRRLATHYCLRSYELPEDTHIAIDSADGWLSGLFRELTERHVRGFNVVAGSVGETRVAHETAHETAYTTDLTVEFTTVPRWGGTLRPGAIGAILQPQARSYFQAGCIVYSPLFENASRLVEITSDATNASMARTVFAVFDRAGFCPVLSRPVGEFATNLLLARHLAPLIAFVAGGGAAADVHASLREFGFVQGIAPLLRGIPGELLRHWVAPLIPVDDQRICAAAADLICTNYQGGVMRADVLDALLLSLSVFAIEAVKSGVLPHPSLVDVMARELIDFPLMHGSLCRFLDDTELARLREHEETLSSFFSAEFVEHATNVLAEGRGFYNGVSDTSRTRQPRRQEATHAQS